LRLPLNISKALPSAEIVGLRAGADDGIAGEFIVVAVDEDAEGAGIVAAINGPGSSAICARRVHIHDVVIGQEVVGVLAEIRAGTHLDACRIVGSLRIPDDVVVPGDVKARVAAGRGTQPVDFDEVAVEPETASVSTARDGRQASGAVAFQRYG